MLFKYPPSHFPLHSSPTPLFRIETNPPVFDSTMADSITDEQLKKFHSMERALYVKLVHEIHIDRDLAKIILSFWLWLESVGHIDVIQAITSHDNRVIELIAREAERCLEILRPESVPPPVDNDIPITAGLLGRPVCLRHFHDYHRLAVQDIRKIFNGTGTRIFSDLDPQSHDAGSTSGWERIFGSSEDGEGASSSDPVVVGTGVLMPVIRSWWHGSEAALHGHWRGKEVIIDEAGPSELLPPEEELPLEELPPPLVPAPAPVQSTLNPLAVPWVPQRALSRGETPENRTMFLTFSRGHPVREFEIIDHFTRLFGNVVQSLNMQRTDPGMSPLYARIVFRYPWVVPMVLNGEEKAQFLIRGKDVWARIYQNRRV